MKQSIFFILLPAIIAITIFSSCTNKDVKEQISRVDSLLVIVDSINLKLNEVNFNHVDTIYKNYKHNWDKFNEVFNDDLDSTWSTVTLYGSVKGGLKTYVKQYSNLRSECDYSFSQLNSLRNNLKAKKITKEEFDTYFSTELQTVVSLKQISFFVVDYAKTDLARYDSLTPIIMSIIDKYKLKK